MISRAENEYFRSRARSIEHVRHLARVILAGLTVIILRPFYATFMRADYGIQEACWSFNESDVYPSLREGSIVIYGSKFFF